MNMYDRAAGLIGFHHIVRAIELLVPHDLEIGVLITLLLDLYCDDILIIILGERHLKRGLTPPQVLSSAGTSHRVG